jgi:hypothetical protein
MPHTSAAVKTLFEERKKFVVVGLTGRTGSGCSTTANLMANDWTDLNPPKPQSGSFRSNDERKYRILYDFAKHNWRSFRWIQIKDIITLFILCEPFEEFAGFAIEEISKDYISQERIFDTEHAYLELKDKIQPKYHEFHVTIQNLPKLSEDHDDLLFEKVNELLEFYLSRLPDFSNKLKGVLQTLSQNSYTKIYQTVGDNIRSSGKAISSHFDPSNLFSIAKSTNKLIKLLRHRAKTNNDDVLVVIDAIRNPFEATFFRDRYSAFYLLAINCPRLIQHCRVLHVHAPGEKKRDFLTVLL